MTKRILLAVIFVLIPISVWSFARPVRLVVPKLNGVVCDSAVCVEGLQRLVVAPDIYSRSIEGLLAHMTRPEWLGEGMAYEYGDPPNFGIPAHYRPMTEKYRRWHSA